MNQEFKNSTFKGKESDPGFLAAKGRFFTPSENRLKQLISSGTTTSDPRISDLKNQIDQERSALEKKHVKDLSSAIVRSLTNYGYATLRCIGRNAAYNACKAIAIARGHCAAKGIELRFSLSFDEGNLGELRDKTHVENVTALVFTLESFKTSDVNLQNV